MHAAAWPDMFVHTVGHGGDLFFCVIKICLPVPRRSLSPHTVEQSNDECLSGTCWIVMKPVCVYLREQWRRLGGGTGGVDCEWKQSSSCGSDAAAAGRRVTRDDFNPWHHHGGSVSHSSLATLSRSKRWCGANTRQTVSPECDVHGDGDEGRDFTQTPNTRSKKSRGNLTNL